MSLYDDLGVPPDASEEEITRAYRKKAQKAHPDRNPDDPKAGEKFHQLTTAYQVLTNAERRKQYDKTGDSGIRDEKQEAMAEIAGLVLTLVEQASNVDTTNIIKQAEASIVEKMKEMRAGIARGERQINRRERAMKRFRNKKGQSNVLEAMLRADIGTIKQSIANVEKSIAKGALMLELLKDYEYVVDPVPPSPAVTVSTRTFRW